jgi:hypothetical protein
MRYVFGEKMTIDVLNENISDVADNLYESVLNGGCSSKKVSYIDEQLVGEFEQIFLHSGLYFFILEKESKKVVAYVGKSENDQRLRQHLTKKNKDGTNLAESVRNKHENIKNAIANGFTVSVHLYSNKNFEKASLSAIEIKLLEKCKEQLKVVFPKEPKWISRIG